MTRRNSPDSIDSNDSSVRQFNFQGEEAEETTTRRVGTHSDEDSESSSSRESTVLNPYPLGSPFTETRPRPPSPSDDSHSSESSVSTRSSSSSSSSSDSSVSSVEMTGGGNSSTATTVQVGNETITYDPAGTTTADAEAFYKKTERAKLDADKLADLFEKATRTKLTVKFDLISSTFSDEDKLDDTYNIGILVNRFKNHCQKYGMLDVMFIIYVDHVTPSKPTGVVQDLLWTIRRFKKQMSQRAALGIGSTLYPS
jgi:hypothetical protein